MATKPRSEWSPAYRQRIERAERLAAEKGEQFSKKRARGKTEDEYQERKKREKAKSGVFWPLTPPQIRQLRVFGATDGDLRTAKDLGPTKIRELIKQQRDSAAKYRRNPRWRAEWTIDEMKAQFPEAPPIMFYYRSNSVWSR